MLTPGVPNALWAMLVSRFPPSHRNKIPNWTSCSINDLAAYPPAAAFANRETRALMLIFLLSPACITTSTCVTSPDEIIIMRCLWSSMTHVLLPNFTLALNIHRFLVARRCCVCCSAFWSVPHGQYWCGEFGGVPLFMHWIIPCRDFCWKMLRQGRQQGATMMEHLQSKEHRYRLPQWNSRSHSSLLASCIAIGYEL